MGTGGLTAVLLCLAAFLAATTQAATGFGFALLFAPLLTLVLAPAIAVQVTIIVTLAISLVVVARIGRHVRRRLLWRFGLGGICGLPLGLWGIAHADRPALQIAIGALVLVATAGLLIAERRGGGGERLMPLWADLLTGAMSGAMTSGLGMPGPPLVIYLLLARFDKEAVRSTLLAVFVFFYGAALALHAVTIGIPAGVWPPAALYTTVAVAGALAGDRLARHLDTAMVRRVALAALALIGAATLAAGLRA
jgi:uncharacterized membrane protein YfcA